MFQHCYTGMYINIFHHSDTEDTESRWYLVGNYQLATDPHRQTQTDFVK